MAFVTEAALIALREGLEALLITGILLGLVKRLGHPEARKHVWAGFAGAVVTSLIAGWAIQRYLLAAFEEQGYGALFTFIAALTAVVTLLYMVFWMWSHTSKVLSETKSRVKTALTTGSLATIVFVTYISTVREGLETVLFYSALTGTEPITDILISGALGFAASALLVYIILRTSRNISVRAFFTATGIWLIIVAAMLTTHVVGAATQLGWIDPAPAIWDTSAFLAADSALGRILHAAVGYTPAPTLLQATTYFGVLFGAGIPYLYQQGFLTTATADGKEPITQRVAAVGLVIVLVVSLVATAGANPTDRMITGGHDHGGEDGEHASHAVSIPDDTTVGVMLRAHGEPLEYNATTYETFANFTRNLLVSLGMEALLEIDQGTVLIDRDNPYSDADSVNPRLMDAWLNGHPGPAAPMNSPAPQQQELTLFEDTYIAPGGPGMGEPDVLEASGLDIWKAFNQMNNESQMHPTKKQIMDQVADTLNERFGDQIVVELAHHIRPMINPREESIQHNVKQLLDADVDVIVDAYTSHLHSDIMNECMKKPIFREELRAQGYTGPVLEAGPSGLTDAFAQGMADAITAKLDQYEEDDRVWLSLTHHGADPSTQSPCKDRRDPYVNQTKAMFANVKSALENRTIKPNVTIQMVYGAGANGPNDGIYSPTEAVENASQWGADYLLDIPYELPGDGYDNLVNHRLNYDLNPTAAPHYDSDYNTHLTRHGVEVKITSSAFAQTTRARAQVDAILHALEDAPWSQAETSGDDHDDAGPKQTPAPLADRSPRVTLPSEHVELARVAS